MRADALLTICMLGSACHGGLWSAVEHPVQPSSIQSKAASVLSRVRAEGFDPEITTDCDPKCVDGLVCFGRSKRADGGWKSSCYMPCRNDSDCSSGFECACGGTCLDVIGSDGGPVVELRTVEFVPEWSCFATGSVGHK
jgi:hypothetical protein